QTYAQWRIVFGIISATYAGGTVMYLIFGTGELQKWNTVTSPKTNGTAEESDKEKLPLRDVKT
ncbi:hypothetical protein L9F63_020008, partial [Diploptera punctata]